MDEDLGKEAYETYYTKRGGVNLFSGARLPLWRELSPQIRACWAGLFGTKMWGNQ